MTKFLSSLFTLWFLLACRGGEAISWAPSSGAFLPLSSRGGATATTTSSSSSATEPKKDSNLVKTSNNTITAPLSQQSSSTETEDLIVLKEDIELLSTILAETVKRSNPKIHDLYEQFRRDGLTRYVAFPLLYSRILWYGMVCWFILFLTVQLYYSYYLLNLMFAVLRMSMIMPPWKK
jgi:hypothetical protein